MKSDIKPDFEAIAKRFFPDTHTEKYYADGPHKILSKKWQSEQDEIEVHRRCFVYGYEKAYNESISTVKRLQEENKSLTDQVSILGADKYCLKKEAERLQEENEQLKEEKKWISVKDRLPEIGTEVIVYSPRSNYGEGRVTALSRLIRYEEATSYYWDNNYGGSNVYIQDAITHWQPLPKPPKES